MRKTADQYPKAQRGPEFDPPTGLKWTQLESTDAGALPPGVHASLPLTHTVSQTEQKHSPPAP